CDDCGVDGADRNSGDPIRVEIHLRQRLVHACLIGTKGAPALEQQRDTFEGRTVSHAARPISHGIMHTVMPSLSRPQFPNGIVNSASFVSTTSTARGLAGLRLACIGADAMFSRQSYFTGTRTGASLSLSKTTKNLAGIVLLALRP